MTDKVLNAADCPHKQEWLDDAIMHIGEPDWAFCYGCHSVLRKEDDKWVAEPTGITKATYRYGR